MTHLDRRSFLRAGVGGAGALWLAGSATACAPEYTPGGDGTPFHLGVMSGLHSDTEVVLWTRLDPDLAGGTTSVRWQVATDPALSSVVDSGTATAGPDADWTIKVLVGGLDPDRSYWYRFTVDGVPSQTGRARTLPAPGAEPTRLRLAFASCQNWGSGWYNAWAGIAAEDLDAVVWLGDYIYESGSTPLSVRKDPIGTARDLDGYRAKYRLYRSDPLMQAGHRAHPFAPIWDDHEVVNNSNRVVLAADPARRDAGFRAWFEYMPVWPIDGTRIHRSLRWGRLAEIPLLDTRQYRDRQPNGFQPDDVDPFIGFGPVIEEAAQSGRTIMGADQRAWLLDRLDSAQADGVRWKLIGNQVMIAPVRPFDLDSPELRQAFPNLPRHNGVYANLDSWDGYQWERDLVLAHLADQGVTGTAFLTGDIHSFWQADLRADYDDAASPIVAQEYVGGSISSVGPNVLGNDDLGYAIEAAAASWSPAFRYTDFRRNGYGVVEARPDGLDVTFRVTRVENLGSPVETSMVFSTAEGAATPTVTRVAP